ncbi:MAG TPA: GNAT family N-acetyltransferase [Bellilinea sp.]|nr:GNAT family N-acetyltransferase [Bellilinea sp.]
MKEVFRKFKYFGNFLYNVYMDKDLKRSTLRLNLVPLTMEDEPYYFRLFSDPQSMQFSMGIRSAEDVHHWMIDQCTHWDKTGIGAFTIYSGDRTFIGSCGLYLKNRPNLPRSIELGYRLLPEYWGLGYATEACTELLRFASELPEIQRIVALVDPQNTGSIHVLRKLGFQYQKELMLPGYDHPDELWMLELTPN